MRDKSFRRRISDGLRHGNGCRPGRPAQRQWLPATPEKLPRWRGFNLLEKFYLPGESRSWKRISG